MIPVVPVIPVVYVCGNFRAGFQASCAAAGGRELMESLQAEIEAQGLNWEVRRSPCLGYCGKGPNLKAHAGPLLHHCTPDSAASIIERLKSEWSLAAGAAPSRPGPPDWPPPGT